MTFANIDEARQYVAMKRAGMALGVECEALAGRGGQ